MRNAYYLEHAVGDRIRESLQIANEERLAKLAESGNRRLRSRQFHDWVARVGRILAARHGGVPNALRRA
jgi:hypothetical protein